MSVSSTRGIFLSLILLSSFAMIILGDAYAQEMVVTPSSLSSVEPSSSSSVEPSASFLEPAKEPPEETDFIGEITTKSYSFEETTILEFTNEGNEEINSFRIWLDQDVNFKSFKTERGWFGEKTPQGVIIFTSSESVKPGESVKIGVKTDVINPGINWKALGKNDIQLGIGQTISDELPEPTAILKTTGDGILPQSEFRIIPERPNAGDKIRVTGNNFGPSHQFEFFIDAQKIGTFVTNNDGYFITTMTIPLTLPPERSDFIVKDTTGNEKKISLRIGSEENKIPISDNVQLSIRGIPEVMQIGDLLEISGTASPNSVVAGKIFDPHGVIINTRTASVDAKGDWELDEPILVPLNSELGRYKTEITDGKETITKTWIIESSKLITITPIKLKFNPGETIIFNGTAIPNASMELSLVDPLGIERSSDVIQINDSGLVQFEYSTTANVDKEGTWTLIAMQGEDREFVYAGLGELPTIPTRIEFDKLSYKATEEAVVSLSGKPGQAISMLIVNPADKPQGNAIPIIIEDDGNTTYILPLQGYTSGIYTAVIREGNSESKTNFAVGLQTGSGEITISTTKLEYFPNDPVLILGKANENVIITLSLFGPDGTRVKELETFTDKEGKISEDGFRIPSEAEPGKWKINAKSGSNFKTIEVEVNASKEEGMVVSVGEGIKTNTTLGKYIDIKVINAANTVEFEILGPEGELVAELSFPASSNGEVRLPWAVPSDLVPGNYTISAIAGNNYAETTFLVK